MSKLKMKIYTAASGVEMTVAWANEEEYKLGNKFLADMGVLNFPSDGDRPASFYLETKQQLESLYEFRRSLRDKKEYPEANDGKLPTKRRSR